MSTTTITQALAEIRTLEKRVMKKRDFIESNLHRQEVYKDPLLNEGGQPQIIRQEQQAITDLLNRQVRLRMRINESNTTTMVEVCSVVKSVAEWLIWKREIMPGIERFMALMTQDLRGVRKQAQKSGGQYIPVDSTIRDLKATDFVVNISERELALGQENLEEMTGALDGMLSLKNATTNIEAD